MKAILLILLLAPSLAAREPEPPPFLFAEGVERVESESGQYRVIMRDRRVVRVTPTSGGYRWTEPDGSNAFYHRSSGGWTCYSRGVVESWNRTYRGYSGRVPLRYEGQTVVVGTGREQRRFLRSRSGWMLVR